MIATRRGLAILAAIALVLAIALVIDVGRGPRGALDRSLVPGLDVADVTWLRWEQAGGPAVELARDGDRWQLVAPVPAQVNPRTVDEVLAALRAARWQRRADASTAGAPARRLVIGAGGSERVLGFGEALGGTEQAWIVAGEHALLVDRWVVGALSPSPLELVVRRPFEAAAQAPAIELRDARGAVRVEGTPRRLVAPDVLLVDPVIVAELESALAALEIVALGGSDATPDALAIEVGTTAGTLGVPCAAGRVADDAVAGAPGDELVALHAPTGAGCVTADAASAVRAAVERLRRPAAELVDRRPAPLDAAAITLPDGTVLDLAKQPRIGDRAADPVRVAELLAVLAAPAEIVAAPAVPSTSPPRTVRVTDRAGSTIVLELVAPRLVRRAGEPVALRLTPAAWEVLTRPGRALREPTLWVEDPLAITTLAIGDAVYTRGAVIGEWTRATGAGGAPSPVSPADARRLDTLAAALASPRALGDAPSFTPRLDVTATVAQPAGDEVVRTLALGRRAGGTCPARVGGEGVLLDASVCDAAHALAR